MQTFLTVIGRFVRIGYLIRVPLLAWIILFGLPFAAEGFAANLLQNLFDLGTSVCAFGAICFCGFLLSAIIIACINAVRFDGGDRMSDPSLHPGLCGPWTVTVFGAVPSFVFAGFVWSGTPDLGAIAKLASLVVAFVLAALVGFLAKAVQLALWDCKSVTQPPPDVVLPISYLWKSLPLYQRLEHLAPLRGLNGKIQPTLAFLHRCLGPGYFYKGVEQPSQLHPRSTQVYLTGIAAVTFVIWTFFGWCKRHSLEYESASKTVSFLAGLPSLAWLLLLLMTACLTLSGLTFFLDRYRLPLLGSLAALSLLTTFSSRSDHYFKVQGRQPSFEFRFQRPADILKSRTASGHKRFILVSTAGGGIQAAAWTAKVLSELDTIPGFRSSLLAISSVSGGSAGSIAYARTFDHKNPAQNYNVVQASETGALDEVAWGWFVPDVWRAINPFRNDTTIDRGWAVDQKWTKSFQLRYGTRDLMLADWADAVRDGMPALIFNASIVENGLPLVLSNTAFVNNDEDVAKYSIANFHTLFEIHKLKETRRYTYDLPVATAARLSAAFPYVAPAARSNLLSTDRGDYHLVDGGYYDNYGITSLFAWLDEAKSGCPACEFLLIRITHFPEANKEGAALPEPHGWSFQTYAPLQGLYNARSAGQLAGDNTQVRLEQENMRGLYTTGFGFDDEGNSCKNPPLSWQLSKQQRRCVERGIVNADSLQCVRDFVSGGIGAACEQGLSSEIYNVQHRRRLQKPNLSSKMKRAE